MSSPSQVRAIYKILRRYAAPSCKDFELLKLADEIRAISDENFDDGYEYSNSDEHEKVIDTYEVMSSGANTRLFQERYLLNCVFDDELDTFDTTSWRKSVHKEIYGY
jgi:hypothetical protein